MDVIAYFRVSTQQQGHSGLGLAAQKEIVMRFLGNSSILQEFIEVESGKNHKNRPELMKALELCKRKKATLVIAKLDRLSRNVAFIATLIESGVAFVCCDNPHANKAMLQMMAVFAELEREQISERIKAALARVKAELALTGHRTSHSGRIYTALGNPDIATVRAKAVANRNANRPSPHTLTLIYDMRQAGHSLWSISRELNCRRITTPGGFKWYASTVKAELARMHELTKERKHDGKISSTAYSCLNSLQDPAKPEGEISNAPCGFQFSGVHMPINIAEGERMIDVFASVGAREFVVTKLDLNQDLIWGKTYAIKDLREKLPAMMRTAEQRATVLTKSGESVMAGENLIIRPKSDETTFIQLDDLKPKQLERARDACFLIVATSPGNYQAWIAASGVGKPQSKEFIRRVRKAVGGVDESASGAVRVAGTSNFKEKYLPEFPVVTITHAMPGRVMTEESLAQLGLIAAPEPEPVKQWTNASATYTPGRNWPSYEKCLAGAPMNASGTARDRSKADFTFCLFSAQRGFSVDEIAAELATVSARARERLRSDPGYVKVTAQNGYDAAMRGKQRFRA
jgi:DNA invertase Pin-like site-specific DNA recombinase